MEEVAGEFLCGQKLPEQDRDTGAPTEPPEMPRGSARAVWAPSECGKLEAWLRVRGPSLLSAQLL